MLNSTWLRLLCLRLWERRDEHRLSKGTKLGWEQAGRRRAQDPCELTFALQILWSFTNSLVAFEERNFHKYLGFNTLLYLRPTSAFHPI